MKLWLPIIVLVLTGCASPTFQMSQEQVRGLSDTQLCSYKNNYRAETKLEAEVARRGVNCDRYFQECLRRGNKPGTEAMDFCMDILRQNERLKYEQDFDDFDHFGRRRSGIHSGVGVGFGF